MADGVHVSDSTNEQLLVLSDVRFGFANRREFLGPVSLDVRAGECWAIVGPNGAGKSTLLRLMAGLVRPTGGVISLASARSYQSPLREQREEPSPACAGGSASSELGELNSISHRDRARVLAYVPQQVHVEGELTVREVVLLGRYPHRGAGYFESEHDERMADRAMALTETSSFARRAIGTLSGGEAQRVHVAAALAQEPRILLLDEPTASLDSKNQLAMFGLIRGLAEQHELAVVIATHDLNLAARYCTHVLLLNDGKVVAKGSPEEVIKPEVLEPVYGVRMLALSTRESEVPGGTGAAEKQSWIVAIERMDEHRT